MTADRTFFNWLGTLLWMCAAGSLFAQADSPAAAGSTEPLSLPERLWVSGQANFITQYNPAFPAKYSGPNSFGPGSQAATSRVMTLYTGFRLARNTEILFDAETAGGAGLSSALGIAGFPNLDVVRNPTLGSAPYIARVMVHQVIPLGSQYERRRSRAARPRFQASGTAAGTALWQAEHGGLLRCEWSGERQPFAVHELGGG